MNYYKLIGFVSFKKMINDYLYINLIASRQRAYELYMRIHLSENLRQINQNVFI